VLLSIVGVAALVLVVIVIALGIVFYRRPVYYATAHIEIVSKTRPGGAHPVDRVFGLIEPASPEESLALLDEMRGPRPGGPRASRN
jgi:hypothetical protein